MVDIPVTYGRPLGIQLSPMIKAGSTTPILRNMVFHKASGCGGRKNTTLISIHELPKEQPIQLIPGDSESSMSLRYLVLLRHSRRTRFGSDSHLTLSFISSDVPTTQVQDLGPHGVGSPLGGSPCSLVTAESESEGSQQPRRLTIRYRLVST